MHWIDLNKFDISCDDSSSLLSVVWFELLGIDYLVDVIEYHPIATQVSNFKDRYLQGINYHALMPKLRQLSVDSIPVLRKEVERKIT